jgi:hypothetical protein
MMVKHSPMLCPRPLSYNPGLTFAGRRYRI